ncbi:MAG: hypothetical protein GTO51_07130 [Candidatus Latescibacteria bacterium]|nr:hypothetical protein [Candidatus Latescibacterota bacterium]NIM22266.1 hypothetical protein [Candidatus Latescibacterota bacterium]NIM65745.1 hypothetical protein [Candidatus Latescibacterota bacterium]NIO02130.1 hypothetical protein [Candidatus Latescibacterota bacterium]NIO28962.1 hypothetical protein [Candidatus Latescibacterota bacterium]
MKASLDRLRLGAEISNPWSTEPPPDLESHAASDLVAVLKENSASLLPLSKRHGQALSGSSLMPFIEEEEAIYRRLRGEFERVRIAFEEKGVETVFIKSTGLYPSFPHLSSNLDVLVPFDRGDAARKTLRDLGYVELLNAEEPRKFLFRRFVWGIPSFTFHLHEEVGWGVPFVDTEAIWKHAQDAADDGDIKVPGAVEALLITLAHWFYEDKILSLGNMFLTAHALRNLPCGLEEAARGAFERGWEDGFYGAIKIFSESWKRIFGEEFFDAETTALIDERLFKWRLIRWTILPKVRYLDRCPARVPFAADKLIYYKKVMADRNKTVSSRLRDVLVTLLWAFHLKARIRSQKPFLIGISGCDGSGKTLQANSLKDAFETCALRTKVIWSRGGSSPFIGFFIRMAKRLQPARSEEDTRSGGAQNRSGHVVTEKEKVQFRRERLRNPVFRFFFSVLYGIDLAAAYCIKARLYLLFGNVVICDRYVADARVDFAVSSGRTLEISPKALRILEFLSPKPNLSFVLDVDPDEALRRKPDEGSSEHLTEARKMFLEIARKGGMVVVPLDASKGTVHENIALESLSEYYKRYRTFLNALLVVNPTQLNPGRWRE